MSVDLGISASPSWPLDSGQREVEVMGASVVTLKKAALCKYRPKTRRPCWATADKGMVAEAAHFPSEP